MHNIESEEVPRVVLEKKYVEGVERFEANEPGIAILKAEFLDEADDYLYLRKGEDFGGDLIGYMSIQVNALADASLINLVASLVVFVQAAETVARYYPKIKRMIADARKRFTEAPWKRKPKDLKLLLWPNIRNEEARPLYEVQGYQVRFYVSKRDMGQHRLYLNEKRYCLFLRTGEDRFLGFIGRDAETHQSLKSFFETEWRKARKP